MIKWYIRKFKSKKYVLKSDIEKVILKAKQNEAKQLNKLHIKELDDIEELKDLEKLGEVNELKAENKRLKEYIDNQADKEKQVKVMYFKILKKAKENAKISGELKLNNMHLLENFAILQGSMEKINEKAEKQMRSLDDDSYLK